MVSLLNQALDCLNRGWSVFPLVPNSKIPLTGHGFKDASKSADKVIRWWMNNPTANIGIATGQASGIVVVDVDVKKKAQGKKSISWIKGLVPKTLTVTTPSGGWHLYYQHEKPLKGRLGFLPGIDIKADGGYVVAPGSVIDGKFYRYTDESLIKKLSEVLETKIKSNILTPSIQHIGQRLPMRKTDISTNVGIGNWNFPMLRLVAHMVRRGYSDSEILRKSEEYTLAGWTSEQTRREILPMILGAKRKG